MARFAGLALCTTVATAATLGCTRTEIPGTYDVELLIEGARGSVEATLILTTGYLEPERREYDRPSGDADADDLVGDPNSCLILPSADPTDEAPRSVTFFEARIRGGELLVPVTIFETPGERMEVTKLAFFAGTAGGEVAISGEDGDRSGRIVGDRVGGPDGARCKEALTAFYGRIDRLIEEAERAAQ